MVISLLFSMWWAHNLGPADYESAGHLAETFDQTLLGGAKKGDIHPLRE
jgi:hypothetical protein